MIRAIIGIGIPGSGKTTALKPFAKKFGYTYINADDIREELTGNSLDQTMNREVWVEAKRRTEKSLKHGNSVVIDGTFVTHHTRKDIIDFVRSHGAEKVTGICAAVPLEIADERNNARERVVPRYAMERMHIQINQQPPVTEDGFDAVYDINEIQKLVRAELHGAEGKIIREFS